MPLLYFFLQHIRIQIKQKDSSSSYTHVINNLFFQGEYVQYTFYRIRLSTALSIYRGMNVLGLIGDPWCLVKVAFAIIYTKDHALLAICLETALVQELFNPLLLVCKGPPLY